MAISVEITDGRVDLAQSDFHPTDFTSP